MKIFVYLKKKNIKIMFNFKYQWKKHEIWKFQNIVLGEKQVTVLHFVFKDKFGNL